MTNKTSASIETHDVHGAPLEFSTLGAVSRGDRDAVVHMLDKVLAPVGETVTHIRVRMEHDANRNRVRTTTLRVVLDFRHGAVRGHVSADTTRAAIDELEQRLRVQLSHRHERRRAQLHRGATSAPGEWRHGDLPRNRPAYFPRPVEEREVVRHKSVAPDACTIEEALFDLQVLDYDFYLFVHLGTGRDAFVQRVESAIGEPGASFAVQLVGGSNGVIDAPDGVDLAATAAPAHGLQSATDVLDIGHAPHVFFQDAASGRGHVLYRRYDGHYGLIVPIDEAD